MLSLAAAAVGQVSQHHRRGARTAESWARSPTGPTAWCRSIAHTSRTPKAKSSLAPIIWPCSGILLAVLEVQRILFLHLNELRSFPYTARRE